MPDGVATGDAVVEVLKALYGLPRGDTDWGALMLYGMQDCGLERVAFKHWNPVGFEMSRCVVPVA